MSAREVGKRLVALCREGKNMEAINTLYDEKIESVEAKAAPGFDQVSRGIEAVRKKNEWWMANHEVHSAQVEGPFPHGDDRFAVLFQYDVTSKELGSRMQMDEVGLFTLRDGKVVKEEFFYDLE